MSETPHASGTAASRRAFLGGVAAVAAASTLALRPTPARAAAASTAAGASVVSQQWVDSRTLDLTISSPSLGTTAAVRLLVPSGWSAGSATTWPVICIG